MSNVTTYFKEFVHPLTEIDLWSVAVPVALILTENVTDVQQIIVLRDSTAGPSGALVILHSLMHWG